MAWQKTTGYQARAKAEAAMSRYKRVIGDALRSRTDGRRATEVAIAVRALNRMLDSDAGVPPHRMSQPDRALGSNAPVPLIHAPRSLGAPSSTTSPPAAWKNPRLVIVDGGKGLKAALASLWDDVPVQRCTVHKERNLLAHAPKHLHEENKAEFNDLVHAKTAAAAQAKRKTFLAKWKLRCRPVADSRKRPASAC